jgi:hypothetical protein
MFFIYIHIKPTTVLFSRFFPLLPFHGKLKTFVTILEFVFSQSFENYVIASAGLGFFY